MSGNITKVKFPFAKGDVRYEYDLLGRRTLISSEFYQQHIPSNGFDAAGNLRHYVAQEINHHFDYDDHYHVITETGDTKHSYRFDSLANRIVKDGRKHTHNHCNQLLDDGTEQFEYDKNGNMIKRTSEERIVEYSYDALDRLVKIKENGHITRYEYDPFNRRLAKILPGQVEQKFVYQGNQEIGIWNNGKFQECCLLGSQENNSKVAIEINNHLFIPIYDLIGNIVGLVNEHGEVVENYRYTAFGESEITGPNEEKRTHSEVGNCWQYAGKRLDEESGFVAFGLRYYHPKTGRWITTDPAGFEDGPNLYAYVHNNPLIYLDQFGLFGIPMSWSQPTSFEHCQSILGNTRFQGTMQAFGGLSEATIGGGLTLGSVGVGAVPGCMLMAHGLDHFITGTKTALTGNRHETATSQLFQMAGLSLPTANLVDNGMSFCGTVGGGAALSKNLVSQGIRVPLPKASASNNLTIPPPIRSLNNAPTITDFQFNRFNQAVLNLDKCGQNNIRILRGWAKSKGWIKSPSNGGPEKWGTLIDNKFQWNLRIKPEASFRENLGQGSNIPRFDARTGIGGENYVNPFSGEIGRVEVGTHLPLNINYGLRID